MSTSRPSLNLQSSTNACTPEERAKAEAVLAACATKPVRRITSTEDVVAAGKVRGWPELHREGIEPIQLPKGVTAERSVKLANVANVRRAVPKTQRRKPGVVSRKEMHAKIIADTNKKVIDAVSANPGQSPAQLSRLIGMHWATVKDVLTRCHTLFRVELADPSEAARKRTHGATLAVYPAVKETA